jgi:hypothetical protein
MLMQSNCTVICSVMYASLKGQAYQYDQAEPLEGHMHTISSCQSGSTWCLLIDKEASQHAYDLDCFSIP